MFERYREIKERRATGDSEYGFTLIELLIVIIVLGILAAIVIFSLTGVTGQSEAAACNSDAKTVETALSAYYAENGSYPATVDALTQTDGSGHGPYLHSDPTALLGTNGYQINPNIVNGEVQVETNKQTPPTYVNYDSTGQTLCGQL